MAGKSPSAAHQRDQLNLAFTAGSSLAQRLRAAERVTGRPRTQIVRAVLDAFVETWTDAEVARQRLIDSARASVATPDAGLPVRRAGRLRPPYVDAEAPAPGFAEVVAARRPIQPPKVRQHLDLSTSRVSRRPPSRPAAADATAPDV